MPRSVTLARFVDVEGHLQRHHKIVPLREHPLLKGRYSWSTEGIAILPYTLLSEKDLQQAQYTHSTTDLGRNSHVLATAIRTEEYFTKNLAGTVQPRAIPKLHIGPKIRPVDSFDLASGPHFAKYFSNSDEAEIHFEYVVGGPWASISHDIVVHEVIHAMIERYLDWDLAPAVDRAALHESLADVIAWLSAARHAAVRRWVDRETGGNLLISNALSRFGGDAPGVPVIRDATLAIPYDPNQMMSAHDIANAMSSSLLGSAHAIAQGQSALSGCWYMAIKRVAKCFFAATASLNGPAVTIPNFAAQLLKAAEDQSFLPIMSDNLQRMGFLPKT